MNSKQMLAPIKITPVQRKWLEAQQKETGNSFAVIVRNLITEQISRTDK